MIQTLQTMIFVISSTLAVYYYYKYKNLTKGMNKAIVNLTWKGKDYNTEFLFNDKYHYSFLLSKYIIDKTGIKGEGWVDYFEWQQNFIKPNGKEILLTIKEKVVKVEKNIDK